jgi:hypothetical protein
MLWIRTVIIPDPGNVNHVTYLTGLENRLFKFFLKILHPLLHGLHGFLFLLLG